MCFVFADLSVLLGCLQVESWIRWTELPSGQEVLRVSTILLQVFSEFTCCVSVDEKTNRHS